MIKKGKIYVDYPSYIKTSNGTKCLYELIEYLESENFLVIKIRRKSTILSKIKDELKIFSSKELNLLFRDLNSSTDWFLACDTTPSPILSYLRKNSARVIWWQLAPYQFLGNSKLPAIGEYNLSFSSFCNPYAQKFFYYQPKVDPEWTNYLVKTESIINKKRKVFCIYTGKGRIVKLPENIRKTLAKSQIKLITRIKPQSRKDYFNFLINSNGLISFDEISQTNLEAASLGLPVFIANKCFPSSAIKNFPISDLKNRITSSSNKFLSMVNEEKLIPYKVDYLEKYNELTFLEIKKILNNNHILINKLNKADIKGFQLFSKYLKQKNAILPIVNGGQSPSSLFINNYIGNIKNKYKFNLICILLNQLDNLGLILDKLKLIRIVERIFIFIFIEKIYSLPLLILKKFENFIYINLKKNKTVFNSLKAYKHFLKKAFRRYN